jgi:hypothetical protein
MWLIWAASRLYGLFAIRGAFPYNRTFQSTSDIHVYGFWADLLWHGLIPYVDFPMVYPPGILPMIALPFISPSAFTAEYLSAAFVVDALVLLALYRSGRPLGAWIWLFGAPLLGPIFWCRLDIFVAGALVAGLLCIETRRFAAGGAWLAWAGLIKLWPFVLPLLLLRIVPRDKWRRFVGATGAVTAFGLLPFMDLGGTRNLFDVLQIQAGRGVEIESVFAVPLFALRSAGHLEPIVVRTSVQFTGAASTVVAALATTVFAAALLMCFVKAFRNRNPRPDAAGWLLLVSVAVMVTSKVLSPQYLVWVVGAVALRIDNTVHKGRLLVATGLLLLATQAQFPFGFLRLAHATKWALPISAAHAAVVVTFGFVAFRSAIPSPADHPETQMTHGTG